MPLWEADTMLARPIRLVWLFIKVSVQNLAAYRFDLVVRAFVSLMHLASELAVVWTIFSNTQSLRGWSWQQMLVMVGVFRMIAGGIRILIVPNMRKVLEEIMDGTLDFVLLKPVNSQFLISIREVVVWRIVDVIFGLAIIVLGCIKCQADVSLCTAILFGVMLGAGFVIVYSLWLMITTTCFWFIRIQNIEMIFWNVFEAGRFPINIYPQGLQFTLTFIFPLAFITYYPAAAMTGDTGKMSAYTPLLAVVLAAAMFFASCRLWAFGLQRYSGASA